MSRHSATSMNTRQHEAARYIDGPLLVLAGAGSGKTRVITEKIAHLIGRCNISASHIAAVTFTNKAAREMKARVSKLVYGDAAEGLTICTFHSLGLQIIRSELQALGLRRGFTIFDAEDSARVLRDILFPDGKPDAAFIDRTQQQISRWKNDLAAPEDALAQAQSGGERTIAATYQKYHEALRAYNAVDFDDLIYLPVRLFAAQRDCLERWQNRIHYLLVDEYQDTNLSQYRLVKQLVGVRGALTVVGDDDQSIYSWRGARPENLIQLEKDFPNLNIIKLEQNYRSTQRILKAANALIANNPHTIEKQLWSELGFGDLLRVIHTVDDEDEAQRIATEIASRKVRDNIPFSDFAVLYRGNHQARLIEIALQEYRIPYHISGGTSFFARTEVKDILGYLRLLVNPDDDAAFLRVINTPKRKIGTATIDKLGQYAQQQHASLLNAIDSAGITAHLTGEALHKLQEFHRWLQRKQQQCAQGDIRQALTEMLDDIDYPAWLRQNSNDARAAERRLQNVHILIDSLMHSVDKSDENLDADERLEHALGKMMLQDMLDQQEDEERVHQVQLMTLHAAKGLEFPHVYIAGMEENLLPHRNCIDGDAVIEERRLAYVGITRAQRTLAFTIARKRKQYGDIIGTVPSRFLAELPPDDLEHEGGGFEKKPEQLEKTANATLSGLRAMFE